MICKDIEIWKDGEYTGADKSFKPILSTYILKDNENHSGVLILPGGGYAMTSWREAESVALKLNSAGLNAYVLYYSVAPNRHPQPIMDVTRAMCIIRENCQEWKQNPEKIAVIGFSAGGHLAASIGVHWNKDYLMSVPRMEKGKNKPNALILSYPVISGTDFPHIGSFKNLIGEDLDSNLLNEMSLEKHISADTPPTFLWHTFEDTAVPVENSMMFAMGLRKNDIPFEMHIYPKGGHGLSLANKEVMEGKPSDPHVGTWIDLCIEWLEGIVFK